MGVVITDNFSSEKLEKFLNKAEKQFDDKDFSYKHLVKADALRIKNYFWEAIDEYYNVLRINGSNFEALKGLGLAYKQIGYVKNAINAFNKAKKINSFDKQLYFEAGCCYCIDHKFCCAVKEYKKALKISPDFLEARFNLAFAYELHGQNSLAIKEYKKIIRENPQHLKAYENLGGLYMKLNLYKSAINIFVSSIKIRPVSSKAYLGIAICFDKLQDQRMALRYYRKYLKYEPDLNNLSHVIERFEDLRKKNILQGRFYPQFVS